MYANRDNFANFTGRLLFQIERLMSDREMFGRAEDLSAFAITEWRSLVKQQALSPNNINFDAKKIHEVK